MDRNSISHEWLPWIGIRRLAEALEFQFGWTIKEHDLINLIRAYFEIPEGITNFVLEFDLYENDFSDEQYFTELKMNCIKGLLRACFEDHEACVIDLTFTEVDYE